MGPFFHIPVPKERHPTVTATEALSSRLGFVDDSEIQDWERHFQDFERIAEFVDLYENEELSDDEKFLLMELILASATDCEPKFLKSALWLRIEILLLDNLQIHGWSIWDWSSIDEESGCAYNDYAISPYLQSILVKLSSKQSISSPPRCEVKLGEAIVFGKFWWKHFGAVSPDAHMLRRAFKDRWIRFHNLPDSKRIPETEEEKSEVLRRTRILANELLGHSSHCWMVKNTYVDAPEFEHDALSRFEFQPYMCWFDSQEPVEIVELVAHVAMCVWEPIVFEPVLRSISRGEEPNVFWVSIDTASVFAPYDGGVDLILSEAGKLAALANKYSNWLPQNSSGL